MRFLLALLLIGLVVGKPLPSLNHVKEIKARAVVLAQEKGISLAAAFGHYQKAISMPVQMRHLGQPQGAQLQQVIGDVCATDAECDGVCDAGVCAAACFDVGVACADGSNCFTDGWCYLDCADDLGCDGIDPDSVCVIIDGTPPVGYCTPACTEPGWVCGTGYDCFTDGWCYIDGSCFTPSDCTGALFAGDDCIGATATVPGVCTPVVSLECDTDSDCTSTVLPDCVDFGELGGWCHECGSNSDCASTEYCSYLWGCWPEADCCTNGGDSVNADPTGTRGCCPADSQCTQSTIDTCGAAQLGFGIALIAAVLHAAWKA